MSETTLYRCPCCTVTWSKAQDDAGYERHYGWCRLRPGRAERNGDHPND